ncbi:MAG: thioredoxin-dependent peroxiredoxin [Frankiales bacterium]|jgi:peroxiredoxin Q/BCP|nr:thioredoxin-dependent peroxiredoxin [Frankiales bacterium]
MSLLTPAQDDMRVGAVAPDFTLLDTKAAPWRLAERLGHGPVVLFFYPTAMAIGCTAETCHFRDLGAEFTALGAQRVGVSSSDLASQQEFTSINAFDFPLLSDLDGSVATLYGARRSFTPRPTKRATYVIGTDGLVAGIVTSELRMRAHADESLAILRRLA